MSDEEQTIETQWRAALKVVIGSGLTVFFIGVVFWAGSTYTSLQLVVSDVSEIKVQLRKLNDLTAIQDRGVENSKRIDKLEDQVNQLR